MYLPKEVVLILFKKIRFINKKKIEDKPIINSIDQEKKCGNRLRSSIINAMKKTKNINNKNKCLKFFIKTNRIGDNNKKNRPINKVFILNLYSLDVIKLYFLHFLKLKNYYDEYIFLKKNRYQLNYF